MTQNTKKTDLRMIAMMELISVMDFATDKINTGRREDSDRKDQVLLKNHLLPFV